MVSSGGGNLDAINPDSGELAVLRKIWNSAVARTMILAVVVVTASVLSTLRMEWLNPIEVAAQTRKATAIKVDEPLEMANHNIDPSTGGKWEKTQNDSTEV